ncbi:hypothetical protein U879_02090, partial [Defluviimonas sp. 20V17]
MEGKMPLEILLIVVAAGMIGITLMLHLAGQTRAFEIADEETARGEWLRHFPDDEIHEVTLAPGNNAALIRTAQGPGLLWSLGADTVAYHMAHPSARACRKGLRVEIGDFAAPAVTLRL